MYSRLVKALKMLGEKCTAAGTKVEGDNVDGIVECIAKHYAGGGGGATLSMPRIRFANYRYDEPVYLYEESSEFTGKITFSVHIQDGTVQIGDQLQVCKMGKTYGKNKLQVFMQKTITAEDIENLAKQPYLQITTDDAAGNTHGADTNRVFNRLRHTDTSAINRNKPKYIRIRRPIYKEGSDNAVNAIFSNVVPVEFGLKFEEIYAE